MFVGCQEFIVEVTNRNLKDTLRAEALRLWGSFYANQTYPAFANPVSLERKHLKSLQSRFYACSAKANGIRCGLLLCTLPCGQSAAVFFDRAWRFWAIDLAVDNKLFQGSLFDGELVATLDPQPKNLWLVHDVCTVSGISVKAKNYLQRQSILTNILGGRALGLEIRQQSLEQTALGGFLPLTSPDTSIIEFVPKQNYPIADLGTLIETKLEYETDGLIFTPLTSALALGTQSDLFKWKSEHTLDFAVRFDGGIELGWVNSNTGLLEWNLREELHRQCGIDSLEVECSSDLTNEILKANTENSYYGYPIGEFVCSISTNTEVPNLKAINIFDSQSVQSRLDVLVQASKESQQNYHSKCLKCVFLRCRFDKPAPNNDLTLFRTLGSLSDLITESELIELAESIRRERKPGEYWTNAIE